jgi:hypothetical protein
MVGTHDISNKEEQFILSLCKSDIHDQFGLYLAMTIALIYMFEI